MRREVRERYWPIPDVEEGFLLELQTPAWYYYKAKIHMEPIRCGAKAIHMKLSKQGRAIRPLESTWDPAKVTCKSCQRMLTRMKATYQNYK